MQSFGRDHQITIGKDRIESIGNHRHDTIAVNHSLNIGGNAEHTIQGIQQTTVAGGIGTKTTIYQLQTSESLVLQGPGGSITLDANGISINGIAIYLKGPVQHSAPGVGHSLALSGTAATGEPICIGCWLKAARERKALVKVDA